MKRSSTWACLVAVALSAAAQAENSSWVTAEEPTPEAPPTPEQPKQQEEAAPAAPAPAPAVQPAAVAPAARGAPTSSVAAGQPGAVPSAGMAVGMMLGHMVSQATFVENAFNPYFGGSLSLMPSYTFSVKEILLSANAFGGIAWEYTLPDNDNGRRVSYGDISVGLSAPAVLKEKTTSVVLTPGLSATLPISMESRQAGSITNLGASLSLSRTFVERLRLSLLGSGLRGFYAGPQNLVRRNDERRDELGNLFTICRANEQYCGALGNNVAWSAGGGLNAAYSFTERLSASVGFSLRKSWKYAVTYAVDEYTPKAVDANGNPVACVGMCTSDSMSGTLGINYSITDHVGASFMMGTSGPVLTRNNKNLRFPWYDFVSQADGLTSYSLTFSASY